MRYLIQVPDFVFSNQNSSDDNIKRVFIGKHLTKQQSEFAYKKCQEHHQQQQQPSSNINRRQHNNNNNLLSSSPTTTTQQQMTIEQPKRSADEINESDTGKLELISEQSPSFIVEDTQYIFSMQTTTAINTKIFNIILIIIELDEKALQARKLLIFIVTRFYYNQNNNINVQSLDSVIMKTFVIQSLDKLSVDGCSIKWNNQEPPVVDRILYANTKIEFKIICQTPTLNDTNAVIRGKKKPILDPETSNKVIKIEGIIGRVATCLPIQFDFPAGSSSNSNSKVNDEAEMNKQFWEDMEIKNFIIEQQGCDYTGQNVKLTQSTNYTSMAKMKQTTSAETTRSDVNYLSTWNDGFYVIEFYKPTGDLNLDVVLGVSMKSAKGYLSADEFLSLIFYGVMCAIYALFAIFWFIWCSFYWRELLKIQFWIGGVILMGMVEKSAFLAEYDTTNRYGYTMQYAILTAEMISCLKRTVSRMLVVIVALGFGIVKPRLGPLKQKVIGMGMLYFTIAAIESLVRLYSKYDEKNRRVLASRTPLAVIDATICYWIFTGLVQTTRALRVRKNVIKLRVYRHFTNTLLFAIFSSVLFMLWSLKAHFVKCVTNWREFWVNDAFWHILFSLLLLVIMLLFRPSNNNQRYAFLPLLDDERDCDPEDIDDLDEEKGESTLFETLKLRSKQQENGTSAIGVRMTKKQQQHAEKNLNIKEDKNAQESNTIDDKLAWVENNIPTSIADQALQALDSEDEIVNTKLERSKMQ
ncbi:unnamed protein product [Didymodactylos carnosus]|uniref:GOST seven transmembrane domain-containing protein n=1 Tax=Didymodactylos carnosus TaxID=1234261 RepID=A0A813TRL9_9BILA|nr:unnamed protein product [Didymodactylos carnosus]CAF0813173.1 unnamed protein product [Didymodactylos carnosus]CAF3583084.1 unnamed protein product [Didymodactylos carnosus]CAF3599032.1 unnamed protein product [Didymodactylos carnosus]